MADQQQRPSAAAASSSSSNGASSKQLSSPSVAVAHGGTISKTSKTPTTSHLVAMQEHSCEICGAAGLSDDAMREHTRTCHVEGSAQCPFCGLSGVAPAELLLHVNQAHLDYLTPDNELISFIDDQTPSVDGDSDSMSECPSSSNGGGYEQASGQTRPALTNGSGNSDATYKLNGGGPSSTQTPQSAAVHHQLHRQQNGHAHVQHVHHQQVSASHRSTATSTSTSAGGPVRSHQQQTAKITSFYATKSQSADASSGCCAPGNRSARGVSATRAMHALKAAHETRSCDNHELGAAGGGAGASGREHNNHHHPAAAAASGASGSASTSAASSRASTPTSAAVGGGGGKGSPLRSQLGLNLKSAHQPAAAAQQPPKSPLQCPMCPYTSDSSNVLEEHINRSHFDPHSPSMRQAEAAAAAAAAAAEAADRSNNVAGAATMANGTELMMTSATSAVTNGGDGVNNGQQHRNSANTLTALACPICGKAFEVAPSLELHVNIEHRDILSPAASRQTDSTTAGADTNGATGSNATTATNTNTTSTNATTPNCCPVCQLPLDGMTTQQMDQHIEVHFPKSPQPQPGGSAAGTSNGTSSTAGGATGGTTSDSSELEKQAQKLREQREFEMLRAQYGMDDQGNFREQSAAGMQRAVYAGEMSVADYYERQVGLRAAESHGIDDGTSCTRSVAPRVASLSATSPNVMRSLMCSAVDHYASSYGDKGWGCGYRNLQMLLSSLLQNTTYNEALYSAWGNQGPSRTAMPSISRLQKMVEAAWAQGFDVQGSEQLGCKLYNTRKWIGATEVVTVLSWLRINCQLIDFHRPTSTDGRHPDLFSWVLRYFEEPTAHTPPLYLQHQGHSRTIIGIEQRANGPQLLILDPSHGPRQVAALGSSQDSLRLIRRGSTAMRAPQYQIVAIRGLIETEEQYQASKVLRSLRIPPDC